MKMEQLQPEGNTKLDEYVARIKAGEDEKAILQGLPESWIDKIKDKLNPAPIASISDIPPQYRGMTVEALQEIWSDPSNIPILVDQSPEDRQIEIERRKAVVEELQRLENKFAPAKAISDPESTEKRRKENNPENLSPENILQKVGIFSNDLLGGNHPAVPDIGLADGTFAGSGKLNMDEEGNVVLTRVADNEDHLTKDWTDVGVKEMIDTSVYHGGGAGLPTSGFARWTDSFGRGRKDGVVGTFRIPAKVFLEMVKRGDAVLGNIGEGEIVLNPAAAKQYLAKVEKSKS
jgi:hypothetical protein